MFTQNFVTCQMCLDKVEPLSLYEVNPLHKNIPFFCVCRIFVFPWMGCGWQHITAVTRGKQTHTCTHGVWLLITSLTTSSSYQRVGPAWSAVCAGSLSQFNQLSVFISLRVHTVCGRVKEESKSKGGRVSKWVARYKGCRWLQQPFALRLCRDTWSNEVLSHSWTAYWSSKCPFKAFSRRIMNYVCGGASVSSLVFLLHLMLF